MINTNSFTLFYYFSNSNILRFTTSYIRELKMVLRQPKDGLIGNLSQDSTRHLTEATRKITFGTHGNRTTDNVL